MTHPKGVAVALIAASALAPGCTKTEEAAVPVVAAKATAVPIKNGPVYFEAGHHLSALDPDTKDIRKITEGEGIASDPAVSPDGTRLAYWLTRGTARALFVMNSDGTNAVEVASMQLSRLHPFESDARIRNRPAWSPDGKRLLWCLGGRMFHSAADGMNPTSMVAANFNFSPAFSPKGDAVAYIARRNESDTNLWTMDASGGNPHQLTIFTRAVAGSPEFSADGNWVFFTKFDEKGSDVWRVSRDGKELFPVTEGGLSAAPSLSPDGTLLVFLRREKDRWTVRQMKADGSDERELLSKPATSPCWARGI